MDISKQLCFLKTKKKHRKIETKHRQNINRKKVKNKHKDTNSNYLLNINDKVNIPQFVPQTLKIKLNLIANEF
jgi:hypothetical protein